MYSRNSSILEQIQNSHSELVDLVNATVPLVEESSVRGILDSEGVDDFNEMVGSVNEIGESVNELLALTPDELAVAESSDLNDILRTIVKLKPVIGEMKRVLKEELA